MTHPQSSADSESALRQVLGAFYKTVDVMKSARNSEKKLMSVWPDDMKAVEDVMLFLENLRDQSSDEAGSPVHQKTTRDPAPLSLQQGLDTTTTTGTVGNDAAKVRDGGNVVNPERKSAKGPLPSLPASSDAILSAREECARELERSFPHHAWLNAACATIRSMSPRCGDLAQTGKVPWKGNLSVDLRKGALSVRADGVTLIDEAGVCWAIVFPDKAGFYDHASTIVSVLAAPPSAQSKPKQDDWQEDPSADERWNAGLDFGMVQLCAVLGVDPHMVTWDAATETLDGDVCAAICNIFRTKYGEDFDPTSPSMSSTEEKSHDSE